MSRLHAPGTYIFPQNRYGGVSDALTGITSRGRVWDNPLMLRFDPNDPEELAFALNKAVKKSGLTLNQIAERLEQDYGVSVKASAISHAVWRGGIRFQRALQILAVCGVTEIEIKSSD